MIDMPRRKASNVIGEVLSSAEDLRNTIGALPAEIQGKIKDLALTIISRPVKKRGRPPKKRGRPRKRGRARKPRVEAPTEV